ncbi:D-alanyl-D-alanine carboxypeptidase/D-alanyl-D-alanine-endopeptidase [Estrella lausannensis]|uniref:D-alanyl-D-alanine carboxypeptidase n=1 Tax=Estrella lausannensis TaxID=483423 RepID=A0A0H5DQ00_9BACT|nr:D-alanyl-D-alanine carboxypeptidase/D-alanyl-D-alanine-endopeptidase [Estrella lausannensis]CRX37584.1 D-alanyl-D-alanine carboxypeptidase [Estrella lausannensis]
MNPLINKSLVATGVVVKAVIALGFLSSSLLSGNETKLPEEMQKIMDQKKYEHAIWGVYVKDLDSGEVLFDVNARKLFSPASTTKLVSVSALLHAFGDDYRFKTPVYAAGKIENSKLDGDLVLVGQGDLTMGGRQSSPDTISYTKMDHIVANDVPGAILTPEDPLHGMQELARQVAEKGIKEITGEIIIDDTLFEATEKRGLMLTPLIINENLIDVIIKPAEPGKEALMSWRPQVPGYSVVNKVKTVEKGGPLDVNITPDEEGKHIVVEGTIPADQTELVRTSPIKDPSSFAKAAFIQALKQRGINVTGRAAKGKERKPLKSYEGLETVALYTSPPLSEYAKLILKVSHNLGADLIPLLLASKEGKKSFDEGMRMIGEFAEKEVKLSSDSFVLIDAAGGNENRLTPEAEIELLSYMRKKPAPSFQRFFDALPILGVDGSLEDFAAKTPAKGKVRAKPGTGIAFNTSTGKFFLITQAYAGYIEGKNGHLHAYIVVVNNASLPEIGDIFQIFEEEGQLSDIIYSKTDGKK